MAPTSDAELAEQLAASERRVGELSAKYLPRTLPTTETTRPPKDAPSAANRWSRASSVCMASCGPYSLSDGHINTAGFEAAMPKQR